MVFDKYYIVGTAGHIDHGKTTLVEALTGKNTDRLKEEKERGISIDIDFASLSYANGTLIGLVDVPGHERFVHNMVAGAVGVDVALIVVDANEGPKPQTIEHLIILRTLGVDRAVVALTKADLVDEEWLELVRDEVHELVRGAGFHRPRLIATSTRTGRGLAELKDALLAEVMDVPARDQGGAFRMPVDKVYSIPGHGTVVTGTVWRGVARPGETLELLGNRQSVRVRGIQSHGQPVESVAAGQRAALNVVGITAAAVHRGYTLCGKGTLFESKLIDVEVTLATEQTRVLRHRDRVHLHLGTAATTGRVLLLDGDELRPGEPSFAQVMLDEVLVCEAGDRFILRSYSPVHTIGGGVVIDPSSRRVHRRNKPDILRILSEKSAGSPRHKLRAIADAGRLITVSTVMAELGVTESEAVDALTVEEREGGLMRLPGGWCSSGAVEASLQAVSSQLARLHAKHRFLPVLPKTLLTMPNATFKPRDFDWLLNEGHRRGEWVLDQANIRLSDWMVSLDSTEQAMLDAMLAQIETSGLTGAPGSELTNQFPKRDRVALALLQYAEASGKVLRFGPDWYVSSPCVDKAIRTVYDSYEEEGPFTLGAVRDQLGTSRKAAVGLLEYMDKEKWTERRGDVRVFRRIPVPSRIVHGNVTDS